MYRAAVAGGLAAILTLSLSTTAIAAEGAWRHRALIERAAAEFDLDPNLVQSVMEVESGGNHTRPNGTIVTSPVGALGAMQLMPATARGLGVNPYDLYDNIRGGAKYLALGRARYPGSLRQQVAFYNGGAGWYADKVLAVYYSMAPAAPVAPPPADNDEISVSVLPRMPNTGDGWMGRHAHVVLAS